MACLLLIDDALVSRMMLKKILKPLGHKLIEASTGTEGLALMAQENPACIFLDLLMPDMDGVELLETLKNQGNQTPVIVVTANIQEAVRQQCLALGAQGFLSKPPKQAEISALLQHLLS